jgi:excisionase family DNA binding protein
MAEQFDPKLVAEIIGGDPLLTPAEAAKVLGMDEMQLYELTAAGKVPSIQPGGKGTHHRYRTSAITQFARFLTAARSQSRDKCPNCQSELLPPEPVCQDCGAVLD